MKINYCYQNGDLADALREAAQFIETIGQDRVHHVIARLDERVAGAWWVDVIYSEE